MVRRYRPQVEVKYDKEDIKLAVRQVLAGELSQRAAQAMYNVPRTTLQYRLKSGILELPPPLPLPSIPLFV